MTRNILGAAVAGALALCGAAAAAAQDYRSYYDQNYAYRLGRAPEWNLAAPEGQCRLRIWVDDKAQVQLHGDQITVNTNAGRRSFDQGSVCTQPLPFRNVEDFKVTAENARGRITDVRSPMRRNNFTGSIAIEDPQNGGDTYELVVSWRNPDDASAPVASNDAYPYYDETRACQDRVRRDFLARSADDAYLEFAGSAQRDAAGPNRERIRGDAWARNRDESRPISYECVLNDRTNRVLSSSYEQRGRSRYSSSD
jgi:hypothetical protein